MSKLTQEEVIKRFKEVHGDRYDYSLVEYKDANTKVSIICKIHGVFEQKSYKHYGGHNCIKCAYKQNGINKRVNSIKRKFNNINQPDDYKLIPIGEGFFTKVDNEDFEFLKNINWYLTPNKYVYNGIKYIHRFIMNCPKGYYIDHINHDTLDNRKSNLRLCTNSQNGMNQMLQKVEKSSKYKGVHIIKETGMWRSKIGFNRKTIVLGIFENEIDAAKAYDKKAKELFGEFALTNF